MIIIFWPLKKSCFLRSTINPIVYKNKNFNKLLLFIQRVSWLLEELQLIIDLINEVNNTGKR